MLQVFYLAENICGSSYAGGNKTTTTNNRQLLLPLVEVAVVKIVRCCSGAPIIIYFNAHFKIAKLEKKNYFSKTFLSCCYWYLVFFVFFFRFLVWHSEITLETSNATHRGIHRETHLQPYKLF